MIKNIFELQEGIEEIDSKICRIIRTRRKLAITVAIHNISNKKPVTNPENEKDIKNQMLKELANLKGISTELYEKLIQVIDNHDFAIRTNVLVNHISEGAFNEIEKTIYRTYLKEIVLLPDMELAVDQADLELMELWVRRREISALLSNHQDIEDGDVEKEDRRLITELCMKHMGDNMVDWGLDLSNFEDIYKIILADHHQVQREAKMRQNETIDVAIIKEED